MDQDQTHEGASDEHFDVRLQLVRDDKRQGITHIIYSFCEDERDKKDRDG